MSRSRILGKNTRGRAVVLEGEVASGETIYPGMVVEETGTTSTAGADTPTVRPVNTIEKSHENLRVALVPDTPPHTNDTDDPVQHEYDAGEHVEYAVVPSGGRVQNLLLADGADLGTSSEANISYDDALATNDDGGVKNATGTDDGLARAREAVDNSSSGGSDGPDGNFDRIDAEAI